MKGLVCPHAHRQSADEPHGDTTSGGRGNQPARFIDDLRERLRDHGITVASRHAAGARPSVSARGGQAAVDDEGVT